MSDGMPRHGTIPWRVHVCIVTMVSTRDRRNRQTNCALWFTWPNWAGKWASKVLTSPVNSSRGIPAAITIPASDPTRSATPIGDTVTGSIAALAHASRRPPAVRE